jgi:hypothetical protein
MRNFYFLLSILFLVSCNNNPKAKIPESDLYIKEIEIEKEKLNSNLVKGVLELIQTEEHLKYPDVLLEESFIAIFFIIDFKSSQVYFSDSIVEITYNIIENYNAPIMEYYKGILNVEGYNVAIFDVGGFGDNYYNIDSLKQISLDFFKPYSMDIILTNVYYIHNGKLNYWTP